MLAIDIARAALFGLPEAVLHQIAPKTWLAIVPRTQLGTDLERAIILFTCYMDEIYSVF